MRISYADGLKNAVELIVTGNIQNISIPVYYAAVCLLKFGCMIFSPFILVPAQENISFIDCISVSKIDDIIIFAVGTAVLDVFFATFCQKTGSHFLSEDNIIVSTESWKITL